MALRFPLVLCVSLLSACGPRGSSTSSATPPNNATAAPSGGDAARIICEAECRRGARCGSTEKDCAARCPTLPVRTPPVWHTDWAKEIAACMDSVGCGHDEDEGCPARTARRTKSADTCAKTVTSPKAARRCIVLAGLTDDADQKADACLASGTEARECFPPFDWK